MTVTGRLHHGHKPGHPRQSAARGGTCRAGAAAAPLKLQLMVLPVYGQKPAAALQFCPRRQGGIAGGGSGSAGDDHAHLAHLGDLVAQGARADIELLRHELAVALAFNQRIQDELEFLLLEP